MSEPWIAIRIQRLERRHAVLCTQLDAAADLQTRADIHEGLEVLTQAIAALRRNQHPGLSSADLPALLQAHAGGPLPPKRAYAREVRVRVPVQDPPRRPSGLPSRQPPATTPLAVGHFSLASRSIAAYKPARETDVQLEVVWTPHRDAPSLIGDYNSSGRGW